METNYILKAPTLIDILCDILREKEVPLQVVRFLIRLLWREVLVFFAGGRECMTLVGYKGLTKGSVLSPFLFNIIGSCADRFIPSGCDFLQYADDLVVYVVHRLFNVPLELVQTAYTSLNVFFSSMGLTISASKLDAMLFTRKHERPPGADWLLWQCGICHEAFFFLGMRGLFLKNEWHFKHIRDIEAF
jgi:hypothetical protein